MVRFIKICRKFRVQIKELGNDTKDAKYQGGPWDK